MFNNINLQIKRATMRLVSVRLSYTYNGLKYIRFDDIFNIGLYMYADIKSNLCGEASVTIIPPLNSTSLIG